MNKFLTILALVLSANALGAANFDPHQQASTTDWQYFMRASPEWRRHLFTEFEHQGVKYPDWAWSWRLGWLQTCEKAGDWCTALVIKALSDKALVVRAQAATTLGRLYDGTQNPEIIANLAAAFQNPHNRRAGKGLFVLQRILFAIYQIGGPVAHKTAGDLAASDPSSAAYWQKLTRAP